MNVFDIFFLVMVLIIILLIWVYIFCGGICMIVYMDMLQILFMLVVVVFIILGIGLVLEIDISGLVEMVINSVYSQVFFFEGGWSDFYNFWKQFLLGVLIMIVMMGLDQDMMQKNLSCCSLCDVQKNMFVFSIVLFFVNVFFFFLGVLLYIYVMQVGIEILVSFDKLYLVIVLQYLVLYIGILFIVGLIVVVYFSVDFVLMVFIIFFCVDFLGFNKEEEKEVE